MNRKGDDYSHSFQGSVGHAIPYDTYQVTISSPKGKANKQVGIYAPSSLSVVNIGGLDYPDKIGPDIVTGQVVPPPKGIGKAWVKAVSLYGNREDTWEISEKGAFFMYNLAPGKYVLMVMKGTKVLKVFFYEMNFSHPPFTIPLD